jgi:hypothetical protein
MSKQSDKSQKPVLTRTISWEEWERGRAYRRALVDKITGGEVLRRRAGDPGKDALLRKLNDGRRGMPFQPLTGEQGGRA